MLFVCIILFNVLFGFFCIQEYDFKFYIKFDTDTTTDVATFSIIRLQCHASPAKWVVQILHKLEMTHVRVVREKPWLQIINCLLLKYFLSKSWMSLISCCFWPLPRRQSITQFTPKWIDCPARHDCPLHLPLSIIWRVWQCISYCYFRISVFFDQLLNLLENGMIGHLTDVSPWLPTSLAF